MDLNDPKEFNDFQALDDPKTSMDFDGPVIIITIIAIITTIIIISRQHLCV